MTPMEAIEKLGAQLGAAISEPVQFRGEVSVTVERARIVEACRYLKDKFAFDMLTDLAGVDHYGNHPRYEVVYHLYSLTYGCRLRLKVKVPEDDLTVDTVTGVWRTADWHEREAFDMFGIRFRGHPNLKRILMWEGYPHHPLRKEFPLAGQETELPDTAIGAGKVEAAPMLGGPFVTGSGERLSSKREPRQTDATAKRKENCSGGL